MTIFFNLASKLVATVFSGLASKSVATVFSGLASKPMATISLDLASKPMVAFLVEPQNQGIGGFPSLVKSSKPRYWRFALLLILWCNQQTVVCLILRSKTKNCHGGFLISPPPGSVQSLIFPSCCQNLVLTFAPPVLVSLVRRSREPAPRSDFLFLFFLPARARSASSTTCISFWFLVLLLIFLWFPHSAHAKVQS
jgi:hypothetical protein